MEKYRISKVSIYMISQKSPALLQKTRHLENTWLKVSTRNLTSKLLTFPTVLQDTSDKESVPGNKHIKFEKHQLSILNILMLFNQYLIKEFIKNGI